LAGAIPVDQAKLANAGKAIKNEELKALVARDLWAVEKIKKEKK
jgi:hypothetical protein